MSEDPEDVHIPIKSLRLNNGVEFAIGAPDPTHKAGYVDTIRQTPQGFMVEVHNQLRDPYAIQKHDATHRVNIYIVSHSAVAWVCAGDLYVRISDDDTEEE